MTVRVVVSIPWVALAALTVFVAFSSAGIQHSQTRTAYRYLFEIKGTAAVDNLTGPQDVAAAPDGTLYVVDLYDHQVRRFDPSGNLLSMWGASGHREGQLFFPHGITVGPDGSVYVADSGNYRVHRFTARGELLTSWGDRGNEPGEFGDSQFRNNQYEIQVGPTRLAAGPDGSVYVVDPGSLRVQIFMSDGTYRGQFPIPPPEPGYAPVHSGIAVAPDGTVMVVERGFLRGIEGGYWILRRFSAAGVYIDTWSDFNDGHADLNVGPIAVAVAPDGTIVVTSGDVEPRLLRYTPDGELVDSWGRYQTEPNALGHPCGLAISPDGSVTVVDRTWRQVHRYSADGTKLSTWAGRPPGVGQFSFLSGIDMTGDGDLFVTDSWRDQVHRFNPLGEHIVTWGSEGSAPGEFQGPADVSVSESGDVYVSDYENHRLQVFDLNGNLRRVLYDGHERISRMADPWSVEVSSDGTVYVHSSSGLQRFAQDGTYLSPAPFGVDPVYGFTDVPEGTSGQNEMYLLGRSSFYRYLPDGTLLSEWSFEPTDIRSGPMEVQPGPDDTVYVSFADNRIRHFALDGTSLAHWGRPGYNPGEMFGPVDLAVMPTSAAHRSVVPPGSLFVSDHGNQRIQVFGVDLMPWRVAAYDNRWLAGYPKAVTSAEEIVFDWGDGAPDPRLPADGFSLRADRELLFGGQLRFHLEAEGGARLWVADDLLVDAWDETHVDAEMVVTLRRYFHKIRLEYNDPGGSGAVRLTWEPETGPGPSPTITRAAPPTSPAPPTNTEEPTPSPSATLPRPSATWVPLGKPAYLPAASR